MMSLDALAAATPAGVVIGEFRPHAAGSREYVAVETGELTVTLDGTDHRLSTGDALYYAGDCVHAFANPGVVECVYYTAMHVAHGDHAQPQETWRNVLTVLAEAGMGTRESGRTAQGSTWT
jgi:hypothetical protein